MKLHKSQPFSQAANIIIKVPQARPIRLGLRNGPHHIWVVTLHDQVSKPSINHKFRQAIISASSLSITAGPFDDNAAITCPLPFRITTPTPEVEKSLKIAASKFNLYNDPTGGYHCREGPIDTGKTKEARWDRASENSTRRLRARPTNEPGSYRKPPCTTRLRRC